VTVLERLCKAATQAKPRSRRGFLLMIVVCLLGVLLMLCLGFLAFAHSEVNSVAHLRDKSDCQDLAQSAIDWMAGNIANELCSGGNTMDANRFVTLARSGGHWWYKPFEPGFTAALTDKTIWPSWNGVAPPCLTPADEAQWIYLPADYLPEGGAAARFSIQVLDPNEDAGQAKEPGEAATPAPSATPEPSAGPREDDGDGGGGSGLALVIPGVAGLAIGLVGGFAAVRRRRA